MLCHGAVDVGTSNQHYLLPPAFPLYLAASRCTETHQSAVKLPLTTKNG